MFQMIHIVREGIKVPLVKIEILKGKSTEYKKKLFDGIHQALVDSWKIPE